MEWWSKPDDDKTNINVSIYSLENYLQVKTFSIPLRADKLFFDNHGQLWLCEFEYYPENKAHFINLAPYEGTVLFAIRSFTYHIPVDQDGVSFFSYYPIINNNSFFISIGYDDMFYLWGFQVISFRLSPFPTEADIFGIFITAIGIGGVCYLIYCWICKKRKKDMIE